MAGWLVRSAGRGGAAAELGRRIAVPLGGLRHSCGRTATVDGQRRGIVLAGIHRRAGRYSSLASTLALRFWIFLSLRAAPRAIGTRRHRRFLFTKFAAPADRWRSRRSTRRPPPPASYRVRIRRRRRATARRPLFTGVRSLSRILRWRKWYLYPLAWGLRKSGGMAPAAADRLAADFVLCLAIAARRRAAGELPGRIHRSPARGSACLGALTSSLCIIRAREARAAG